MDTTITTTTTTTNPTSTQRKESVNNENSITASKLSKQIIILFDSENSSDNAEVEKLMKSLLESPVSDISFYASIFLNNEELFQSILNKILLDSFGQKSDIVCKWFYTWYHLNSCLTSKKFVLSFLPVLLWVYLTKCGPNNALVGLESVLICIYNQEYIKRGLKEKVFNPPTLSLPSYIYKSEEIFPSGNSSLTESMLKNLNQQSKSIILEKPLPRIESITSHNRNILIKTIQSVYTQNILSLSIISRVLFCEMTTRISALGYKYIEDFPVCERIIKIDTKIPESNEQSTSNNINNNNNNTGNIEHYKPITGLTNYLIHRNSIEEQNNYTKELSKKRVFLSETIYQDLITALTLCAFQETTRECAKISINSINKRASFDLIAEIMLSTNSLLHILNQKKEN
ncbi:hypothetical protein DICPUDRAFT_149934 [Dictyostelium purpureum]|uniref:Uncharacterized protein n=1 Tax=Dictyostelium purpureum TaxID=5786 RepID=F0ZF16_DICPU|nr:uncharacterized protein DICPUDRAFT_149934 [Dictyostelium purpureum]EGC37457.1 hypothetical protein DICPUDRAFT_149934 [Dictyostelium purpureum]|eukprot:XP_003286021.1 hypothetical protein DICPUDRAFT_149934 [Dictyostelium purpureum]